MDENKQITPSEEITDTETLEDVANATTEKATADVAENSAKKNYGYWGNRKQCGRNRKEKYIRFKTKKSKRG